MLCCIYIDRGFVDRRLLCYLVPFTGGVLLGRVPALEAVMSSVVVVESLSVVSLCVALLGYNLGVESVSRLACSGFVPLCLYVSKKITYDSDVVRCVACAFFCMYLFHRVVYHVLLLAWQSDNAFVSFCYFFVFGGCIIFMLSYYVQRQYGAKVVPVLVGRN